MIKIPVTLQIVILAVAMTGVYTMVGQSVPQKEVRPPEVIEIATDVSTEQMVEIGKGIFEGKGICHTCHTIGKSGALRFPDLDGIATRSATRIPGYTALDYLAESLYEPDKLVVEGFNPGMPKINKPPIGLTDQEILAVIAYLETLGGTATVTMETRHAYNGGTLGGGGAAGEIEAAASDAAPAGGPLARQGCARCHYLDRQGDLAGPSLAGVGSRLDRDGLLSALVYHSGDDGIDTIRPEDLRALVEEMSQMRGEG